MRNLVAFHKQSAVDYRFTTVRQTVRGEGNEGWNCWMMKQQGRAQLKTLLRTAIDGLIFFPHKFFISGRAAHCLLTLVTSRHVLDVQLTVC
ncbi:hypothetical protein RRG08_014512 [Elysia crispata]|uniref:Uncharacterized protein n=1 Tax=Elysia crispata TaxID=231223 RepID=A0AAE1E567_9GAST|nr:hypothetical protein RRG08_014512 [Elysia crispata]